MAVRDLLVEDLHTTRSTDLYNIGNSIEVDAAPMLTWPYDTTYRNHVPFSPHQTEQMTVRKGPDADSVCDLDGNSETVRISGAVGFVLENCIVRKGLNGAVFLYVTDTGAKLDATLRGDALVLYPTLNPHFAYDPSVATYENDPVISIGGRPMSRNPPFNARLDLLGNDPQLMRNRSTDENELYFLSQYLYMATPSQVLLDGVSSQIVAQPPDPDALYRAHVREALGLTGKLIVKDSRFIGGGKVLTADATDLWANLAECLNAPITDLPDASTDEKGCSGSYTSIVRGLVPGRTEVFGYAPDGGALTLPDPFAPRGSVHASWVEFIGVRATGVSQAELVTVLPGAGDGTQAPLHVTAADDVPFDAATRAWPVPDPPVVLPQLP
jgi:hypothetical protein